MFVSIVTCIAYILQEIPMLWAFNSLCEPKKSRRNSLIAVSAVHFPLMFVKVVMANSDIDFNAVSYTILDTIIFAAFIAVVWVMYKGTLRKLFLSALCYMLLPSIASVVAIKFAPVYDDNPYLHLYPMGAFIVAAFMWMLTPLCVYLVGMVDKKYVPKNLWMYFVFPITQFIGTGVMINIIVYVPKEQTTLYVITVLTFVLSFFANIVIMLLLIKRNEQEEINRKLSTEAYINRTQKSYYQYINSKINDNMKIRHDMKNILKTVETLNDSEEGTHLAEMLKQNIREAEVDYFCENRVISAVLYDKKQQAESKGITFETETILPDNIGIDSYDLCILFSNIIDNAIESAEKSENKFINIKGKVEMEHLFIRVDNSFSGEGLSLKTTKRNKNDHGYGLEIIRDITKKHNGEVEYSSKDDVVSCRIWLHI